MKLFQQKLSKNAQIKEIRCTVTSQNMPIFGSYEKYVLEISWICKPFHTFFHFFLDGHLFTFISSYILTNFLWLKFTHFSRDLSTFFLRNFTSFFLTILSNDLVLTILFYFESRTSWTITNSLGNISTTLKIRKNGFLHLYNAVGFPTLGFLNPKTKIFQFSF